MGLRPYQEEAINAVKEGYRAGRNRLLISMATGTGKTIVFAALPEAFDRKGRWMVLVHRKELATQAANKVARWNPHLRVGIDMGDSRPDGVCDVVVASVQSLGMSGGVRINDYDPDQFAGMVIDEAHHASEKNESYAKVIDHFGLRQPGCRRLLLGVTATPNRSDGTGLSHIFEEISYTLSMYDAVTQGWLSDIHGIKVSTAVALDDVKVQAGDFQARQLEQTVNIPARNKLIVSKWIEKAEGRKTVAFCVDIQHAKDLAAEFKAQDIPSEAVWGVDPDRKEKLEKHRRGEITVLTNAQVLTEGYDDWSIRCVLMAKPTKSTLLYTQMIGRGTRLQEGIDNLLEAKAHGVQLVKEDCLVMDVVDNTSKHSLVTMPSLFGLNAKLNLQGRSVIEGKKYIEEMQKKHPMADLSRIDDIDQLEARIEDVDLWKVKYADEVQKESALQFHKTPDGAYLLHLNDGDGVRISENMLGKWQIHLKVGKTTLHEEEATRRQAFRFAERMIKLCDTKAFVWAQRNAAGRDVPATSPQLGMLRGLGIPFSPTITKGDASQLITRYKTRQFDNLFTKNLKGNDNAEA